MRYLKPHPIYEGKVELDELMDIINTTSEGTDLKGLCELEPKRTGRIFVKPRGLAGSKTFIEKTETNDPNFTRVWHYTSLSNGVPFGGDRFTDAKYAIRDLWAYIISKNAPIGYSKDDFKRWLLDSQACGFHGKGASGMTIIDAYIQTKTPAGMITDADQYFATPEMQQKLAEMGLIKSSGNPARFTLELDVTSLGKMLTELSTSLIGYHSVASHLTKLDAEITLIPHAIKFTRSGERSARFKIGGLLKDLGKLEKKILDSWGRSIKTWIEESAERSLSRTGISKQAEAFYMIEKSIIISLSEKIRNLDSTSTSFSIIDDGKIRIIADALKDDVSLVASLPKDISGRVLKLLGYSDNEAEGIIDLKDLGLF